MFYFVDVSPLNVFSAVKYIKSGSFGSDGISIKILKPVLNGIFPVLISLFNHSLQYCVYTEIWKEALIRPVPKATRRKAASDFRSISILSKILE